LLAIATPRSVNETALSFIASKPAPTQVINIHEIG
jgi:hypothetical protein